jgi:neutral amino acid transport system permease protein
VRAAQSVRVRTAPRSGARPLVVALVAVALTLMALLPAMSASAAPTSTPAAAACAANEKTGCLVGTIQNAGKGVDITVTGPGGFSQTTTTDADGKWNMTVTDAGSYTAKVEKSSLPKGFEVTGTGAQRTVNVTLGLNSAVLFSIDNTNIAAPSDNLGDRIAQNAASGLRLGLLLALAAIGLSLIFGTTGISSFAHGEQVTMGGLFAYFFANVLGLNLILASIITVIVCAATGYVQDAIIWKPLRKRGLSLTQLMIVTIGLSLALQYVFQYFVGAATVRIVTANPSTVRIGPVVLTVQSYVAMGIAVVVLAGAAYFLLKTRVGRATRAVSDNPALAAASGIDVDGIIRLVWTVSAGLAGLSGIMLGLVLNGVNWQTGLQLLLLIFAAVTLGGLGTAFGALVGSLIIGMVVELSPLVLPADFKYATALVILIVLLLFRPQGIFGRRERIG